jgi:hypothetical protein
MFEALRGKVAANVAALAPASTVDLERVMRQEFHQMEIERLQRYAEADEYDTEEILEGLREDEAVLSRGLNEATQGAMASTADKLLEKHGLYIGRSSSGYWNFLDQVLRAELERVRRAIEAYRGNPREPKFDRLFADIGAHNPPSSGGLTLGELIERYEKDPGRRSLTDKTRDTYATIFRVLRELLGENKRARENNTGRLPPYPRNLVFVAAERQQTLAGAPHCSRCRDRAGSYASSAGVNRKDGYFW